MLLAIDQGTTGTTCLVVDQGLAAIGRGYREISQRYPRPGWVEHDPVELWESVLETAASALAEAGIRAEELSAIGLTNQRETTIVWERATGRPVYPAIVWQDRRTAARCAALPAELVRERTGLVCDPYFSASKLEWILDEVDRSQAELAFGTVDSWIAWNLTGGAAHVIDLTNASRTMLVDLERGTWDAELLRLFSVDPSILPSIVPSCGVIAEASLLGATVPLAGIAGDQQAALFGQGCFVPGEMKATYGTGTFVLAHVGELAGPVAPGLLKTAAATPAGGQAQFAAEGSVLVGGAALQWLRDGLGLIGDAAESEQLAREAGSSGGVFFVPALTGLGSPQWDAEARGLISGITRGTTRGQIVRAALEAMAHQVADIVDVLPVAAGVLRADGGATANGFLMQLQADLIGVPVEVSADADATALGAAALAGLAIGIWPDVDALVPMLRRGTRYEPSLERGDIEQVRENWRHAVRRATLPR